MRSFAFEKASEIFSLVRENPNGWCYYGSIVPIFNRWLASYESGLSVRLYRKCDESYYFIHMINRFQDAYRKRTWARYDFLNNHQWELMLTLTVDPSRFSKLKDEYSFIVKAWNRLRSALVKRYGKFHYVRVLEPQKRGSPHLHLLLEFGYNMSAECFREFREYLNYLWLERYGGGFLYLHTVYDSFHAESYVLKYVCKSMDKIKRGMAALLFASNKRLFSTSIRSPSSFAMNLIDRQLTNSNSDSERFVYSGVVSTGYVSDFCKNFNLVDGETLFLGWSDLFTSWGWLFGRSKRTILYSDVCASIAEYPVWFLPFDTARRSMLRGNYLSSRIALD